jgi:Putative peptidoglycan binding domain
VKIKLAVAALTAAALIAVTAVPAAAHDDYRESAGGDHYGHYNVTADNTVIPHPGTVSNFWLGSAYGNPATWGQVKIVNFGIYSGGGGSCTSPNRGNMVTYVKHVLYYDAGQYDVFDGPSTPCYDIYVVAAVQNLERFFGLPVDGVMDHNAMDAIDYLAGDG